MNDILKVKRVVNYVKKGLLLFLFSFVAYMISSENMLDYVILTGLPITNIHKLLAFHLIANLGLFLTTVFLGASFIKLYFILKNRNVPFVGFIWVFGVFKLIMSCIFLMNLLSLWRVHFWIDASIRIMAFIFSAGAAISFGKSLKSIHNIKSPEEYQQLKDEMAKLRSVREEISNIKTPSKN